MDDMGGVVGAALAALAAAVDAVVALTDDPVTGTPLWRASDAEVAGLVITSEAASRRLAGVQLAAVAEASTRGLPAAAGCGAGSGALGAWVRSLVTITPGDAARRAALAATLFTGPVRAELSPTRAAVLGGAIGPVHATTVVAALARLRPPATPAGLVDDATLAEAQTLLLAAAAGDDTHSGVDPGQLAKAGTVLTAMIDPGAGARLAGDEDAQRLVRAFALTPLPSGMFHAAGLLTKEVGHALTSVLHALSAPRPGGDGTPDPRTAPMRMHDGLGQAITLLQAHACDGSAGLLPSSHGSPNRLIVTVPVEVLAAGFGAHPGAPPAELPGRWPLSAVAAQTMACDADLVAVLLDPGGDPLDVADTVYPFSTRQRTAVIARDRHCTFGACTAPASWCDLHHLAAFSRGGPTAVSNAALLCGVHHRYVHANNLTGAIVGAKVTWQAPTGSATPHLAPVAVQRAIGALTRRWLARSRHASETG